MATPRENMKQKRNVEICFWCRCSHNVSNVKFHNFHKKPNVHFSRKPATVPNVCHNVKHFLGRCYSYNFSWNVFFMIKKQYFGFETLRVLFTVFAVVTFWTLNIFHISPRYNSQIWRCSRKTIVTQRTLSPVSDHLQIIWHEIQNSKNSHYINICKY